MKALFDKFLNNSLTAEELSALQEWLRHPDHQSELLGYIQKDYDLNQLYQDPDLEAVFYKLWNQLHPKPVPVKKLRPNWFRYAAAAVVLGLLTTGYFLKDTLLNSPIDSTPIIVNNQIQTGTDKATLTLADGSQVTLVKGKTYQANNATSNGEEIVYQETRNQKPETRNQITYNTLTIPRGGQFQITLADGTQVWLNSASQIKYPVAFTKGEPRQVELVYGEAYFEVSPSTAHQGATFKVLHQAQEVVVLGTEFNIKAYKDETHIYTTLVEGKVAVKSENQNEILKPGEQAICNSATLQVSVGTINLHRETSWKQGEFSFKLKSLKEILQVLSRWYDMEVVFENAALENERFTGSFYKNRSIEEILASIKNTNIISNYEIHGKRIVLK
ncbi:FecR family protein [uncultured Polaribacter sp.]|uniref:FecR family protein n=1 Tax=uncultured Polaribacter sp. TaxID=174711 RepID=UPI002614BB21|nr:FecR domain-containing protein [uncultured Polaribacter sp.]